jgi:4-diphosphocytidyl-2-C-methyl-D-erythritol kinase
VRARPARTRVSAPAKLNLGLRVVGRRPDGLHLLESVFVPLDLADEIALEVEVGPARAVALRVEGGPPELDLSAANLASRAATAFLEAAGCSATVRIELTKRIPVGAGLGGGSSDAGAVLRALDTCLPDSPARAHLPEIAVGLGADVPFFLDPRPSLVLGIGERIEPLAGVPALPVVVATPAPSLSTAAVFEAFSAAGAPPSAALTPAEGPLTMLPLPALLERGWHSGHALRALLVNDLEPVAARLRPDVGRVRREIERAGARAVGMSGSGPTVFGVFGSADEARAAAARIPWEPSDRVHVGRTTGSP